MALRLHLPSLGDTDPGLSSSPFELPPAAARHVQVRRLQPGDPLRLFDGKGREWDASVTHMGRQSAQVQLIGPVAVLPELPWPVTLAVGMPANERMDTLVEKLAELGAAIVQPLITSRSVLRLDRERAQRRREHWQAVASAACEQCGRATVPVVALPQTLERWFESLGESGDGRRWLLSPEPTASPLASDTPPAAGRGVVALSGPEGGLSPAEAAAAAGRGFVPVSLGPRVLRADTAPLAAMAWLSLWRA